MTKYLIKRLIRGLISVIIVVFVVMILVYSLIDRDDIFKGDFMITKKQSNEKIVYKYERWEDYGYLDYFTYTDYLNMLVEEGTLDESKRTAVAQFGATAADDSDEVKPYVEMFNEYCKKNGYTVVRLDAVAAKLKVGGQQRLFSYKDVPIFTRLWRYITSILEVDTIHYVENDEDLVVRQEDGTYAQAKRGLTFTFFDPAAGGKFSPAIMGTGTKHKYLLYFDNKFPFIHQNIVKLHLGKSFSVNQGIDVVDTMTSDQGSIDMRNTVYPTGLQENSSDDLHTAIFAKNTNLDNSFIKARFVDKYTDVSSAKVASSRIGLSFTIGILASILAYLLGVPIGIAMARNKGKWFDKIATAYIVFILAVPSLVYIFIFRTVGMAASLPGKFDIDSTNPLQYVLPIISLALPSVAGLMQWLRRYMIDQMNSDYVKFARSGGMSERGIFTKHILKNAAIPLVHGIPGTILGALVGAIITETVYSVPGTGRMLTEAINLRDNAVIVGLTGFYAILSILSFILGDILMAIVDPRISFSDKAR
ncbi:MAG: ABC transporter permease [Clostridia bacterium]|nr:ABC transporter permease [Clostridia bacterium]